MRILPFLLKYSFGIALLQRYFKEFSIGTICCNMILRRQDRDCYPFSKVIHRIDSVNGSYPRSGEVGGGKIRDGLPTHQPPIVPNCDCHNRDRLVFMQLTMFKNQTLDQIWPNLIGNETITASGDFRKFPRLQEPLGGCRYYDADNFK